MKEEEKTISKVVIGSDHAGLVCKEKILQFLLSKGFDSIEDVGTFTESSVDYPDIAHQLCKVMIANTEEYSNTKGILICGTGIGVSIAANKVIPSNATAESLG
ncbi:Sugar-phosphate isomerase RpiB/LacA/LacB family, partial [Perkinsela sp. CCAP 1560/4]